MDWDGYVLHLIAKNIKLTLCPYGSALVFDEM